MILSPASSAAQWNRRVGGRRVAPRLVLQELLAHEQHRNARRGQQQPDGDAAAAARIPGSRVVAVGQAGRSAGRGQHRRCRGSRSSAPRASDRAIRRSSMAPAIAVIGTCAAAPWAALEIAARTLSRKPSLQVASKPAPPSPRSRTIQSLTGQYSAIWIASGFAARSVAGEVLAGGPAAEAVHHAHFVEAQAVDPVFLIEKSAHCRSGIASRRCSSTRRPVRRPSPDR